MTTENRMGGTVLPVEASKAEYFLQLISIAREHGEQLLSQGKDPQMTSVAVHEYLLRHFNDSLIQRRKESPFDVTVTVDGEKYPVFLDIECHRIIWDVMRYLVSENQESDSWNLN